MHRYASSATSQLFFAQLQILKHKHIPAESWNLETSTLRRPSMQHASSAPRTQPRKKRDSHQHWKTQVLKPSLELGPVEHSAHTPPRPCPAHRSHLPTLTPGAREQRSRGEGGASFSPFRLNQPGTSGRPYLARSPRATLAAGNSLA